MSKVLEEQRLTFQIGTSDKEYRAVLEEMSFEEFHKKTALFATTHSLRVGLSPVYAVFFSYGRRGAINQNTYLKHATQDKSKAERVYRNQLQSKIRKGYVPDEVSI